jgi:hypothetical protein
MVIEDADIRRGARQTGDDCGVMWTEADLRRHIDGVTVDAYGDYEQLSSFACLLDELLAKPAPASVVGQHVELLSIHEAGQLLGLRARCRREGRTHEVALVDVTLEAPVDPELDLTLAAYRRWLKGFG